jgi:hypothetical protein
VAGFGLIALAAVAVVGLALEGLSFLYVHPLLRRVAEKDAILSRIYPQHSYIRNLQFWKDQFDALARRAHIRRTGYRTLALPENVLNDVDKLRGFAVVLFLSKANKELFEWTISHFGAYYLAAAALQLVYIAFAGEFILIAMSYPKMFASVTYRMAVASLPISVPVIHAVIRQCGVTIEQILVDWVTLGYLVMLPSAFVLFWLESRGHAIALVLGIITGYMLLFLAMDKHGYTYAMIYRFCWLYLSERSGS